MGDGARYLRGAKPRFQAAHCAEPRPYAWVRTEAAEPLAERSAPPLPPETELQLKVAESARALAGVLLKFAGNYTKDHRPRVFGCTHLAYIVTNFGCTKIAAITTYPSFNCAVLSNYLVMKQ